MYVAIAVISVAVSAGLSHQKVCDPFGRSDVECFSSNGPETAITIGASAWQVEGFGGRYRGHAQGTYAQAAIRANAFRIGPIHVGIDGQFAIEQWKHEVFSDRQTALGTSRSMRAGFAGIHIGWGDYRHPRVYATFLPGYWQNTYNGTLHTKNVSSRQLLSIDQSSLTRIRLDAERLPLGNRVLISARTEYAWYWPTITHVTHSSVTPRSQILGTLGAEICMASEHPCHNLYGTAEIGFTSHSIPITGSIHTSLGVRWLF